MNRIGLILKRGLYGVLRYLPGSLGETIETKYYWVDRKLSSEATQNAFLDCLSGLEPDALCVDLGANVGLVSEQILGHAGHVHAFEPDPWAFEQLSQRLGDHPRATLHNAAIGTEDGVMTLMRDPSYDDNPHARSQGTSAFTSTMWGEGKPDTIEVDVIGMREFLRGLDRDVSLMKIDIEGAEVPLLEMLVDVPERHRIKTIFVETHEAQIPELRARTRALRDRVRTIDGPVIHFDWQ